MKTTYYIRSPMGMPPPKRGDLLQSNIGKRTERTWLILHVRERYPRRCKQMGGVVATPYKIWAERWWDIEPDLRVRLFRSAERSGGQNVFPFYRFPPKAKKRTFEQHMRREIVF